MTVAAITGISRSFDLCFVLSFAAAVSVVTAAVTAAVFVQRLQEVLVELGHQRLVKLVVDGVQREAVLVSHVIPQQ